MRLVVALADADLNTYEASVFRMDCSRTLLSGGEMPTVHEAMEMLLDLTMRHARATRWIPPSSCHIELDGCIWETQGLRERCAYKKDE